jgi:hypothetical protein
MKYTLLLTIVFFQFISCTPVFKDTFNSVVLTSSKGEKLYINSINWGVTGDYQRTIITKDKDALKSREYHKKYIERLEPFYYSFHEDTLKLYFDGEVTYKTEEMFKTIRIEYIELESRKFDKLRIKAYENDGYFTIPKRVKKDMPSDMPPPPPKMND